MWCLSSAVNELISGLISGPATILERPGCIISDWPITESGTSAYNSLGGLVCDCMMGDVLLRPPGKREKTFLFFRLQWSQAKKKINKNYLQF